MFFEKDEYEIFQEKLQKELNEKIQESKNYEISVLKIINEAVIFNKIKNGEHVFFFFSDNADKIKNLLSLKRNLSLIFKNAPRYEDVLMFSKPLKIIKSTDKKIEKINKKEEWNFVQMYATYLSFAQKNKDVI